MSSDYSPAGPDEREAYREILRDAFHVPFEKTDSWIDRAGGDGVRVFRSGGDVVAGLMQVAMGQWFGGRSVPTVGVVAVGTRPESRGTGAATELMRAFVRELHANGVALSTLFPSTRPLYGKAGYEIAGGWHRIDLRTGLGRAHTRDLPVRAATEEDEEAVRAAYAERASISSGWLDRAGYIWERTRRGPARGYVVEHGGHIEAYVFLRVPPGDPPDLEVRVTDLVALTSRAGRRILGFLSDHFSLIERVKWFGDPSDPLLLLVPEIRYDVRLQNPWMLRVVDVRAALAGRGYPDGARATLHLRVRDDLVPENDGDWRLDVEDGRGRVERGGEGRVAVDVRGLATLYSGHLPPRALRTAGLLDGPADDLKRAAALFAGPAPAMPDQF